MLLQYFNPPKNDSVLFCTVRNILFSDGNRSHFLPGFKKCTEAQLKNIRLYLIKFVANYNKEDGDDIFQ